MTFLCPMAALQRCHSTRQHYYHRMKVSERERFNRGKISQTLVAYLPVYLSYVLT